MIAIKNQSDKIADRFFYFIRIPIFPGKSTCDFSCENEIAIEKPPQIICPDGDQPRGLRQTCLTFYDRIAFFLFQSDPAFHL
jgi:hypothetical protein